MRDDLDQTMYFNKNLQQTELTPQEVLKQVYTALETRGYEPLNQMVGYLLSGDPAYITSYNNARALIKRFDRDQYVEAMLTEYLGLH